MQSDTNSPFLSKLDNAHAHRHTPGEGGKANTCSVATASESTSARVNVIIDGNSRGDSIHNGQHLSSFQRMVERSPSYIELTLSISTETEYIPVISKEHEKQGAKRSNTGIDIQMTKRDKIRREWEETCLKWGFVVVRQLTYIQKTCADILPGGGDADRDPIKQEDEKESSQSQSVPRSQSQAQAQAQSTIIVNGYPATKQKDELLVSTVQPRSTADEAGLVKGDVIHSVYGMKDPTLSLLFGIMRDSTKFLVKVERMESSLEREMREKQMDWSDVGVTANANVTANSSFVPLASLSTSENCTRDMVVDGHGSDGNKDMVGGGGGGDDDDNFQDLFGESVDEESIDIPMGGDDAKNMNTDTASVCIQSRTNIASPESTSGPGSRVMESYSLESYSPQEILAPDHEKAEKKSRYEAAPVGDAISFNPLNDPIAKKGPGKQSSSSNDGCVRKGLEFSSLDRPEVQEESKSQKNHVAQSRSNSFSHDSLVVEEANSCHQSGVEVAINSQSPSAECSMSANDKDVQMAEEIFLDSHIAHTTGGSEIQNSRNITTGEDEVRNEESLLTTMIEKSITNELKDDVSSRNKKLKSKINKRKLSEDSTTNKKEKVSKSKRKKERRQSEDESAKKDDEMQTEKSKKKRKKDRKASEDLTKTKKSLDEKLSKADKDSSGNSTGRKNTSDGAISSGKPPRRATSDKKGRDAKLSEVQTNNTQQKEQAMSGNGFEAEGMMARRSNSVTSIDWGADSDSQSRARRPSPLTVPRASPLPATRQTSKTISSTSSKAGLGAVKSAKLKRLWPDSSVFSKRILKWSPPDVVMEDFKVRFKGSVKSSSKSKLPVIPAAFRDTSELIKFMSPHILEEGIHSVNQEFMANSNRNGLWTRAAFSMHLRVSNIRL